MKTNSAVSPINLRNLIQMCIFHLALSSPAPMSKAERKQLVEEASEKLHNIEATDSGTSDLDNKNM